MYCSQCGRPAADGGRICSNCGAVLPERAAVSWYVHEAYVPEAPAAAPAFVPARPPEGAAGTDRRYPPMRSAFHNGALATLLVFAVQTAVIVLAIFAAVFAFLMANGVEQGLKLLTELDDVLNDPERVLPIAVGYAAVYFVSMLLGILVSRIFLKKVRTVPVPRARLGAGRFWKLALITFGVWGVGVILGSWAQFAVPAETQTALEESVPMLIVTMLGAPVLEELIFRKFLLDRLLPFGERTAAVFTALLFGMAHQNAMQFFLAFFVGLVFARVYIRTGSIVYTMLLHFMINAFASVDTIGCMLFGDGFDTVWLIAAGVLVAAGLATLLASRRAPFLALEPNYIPGANRAAFRNPGMTVCKILAALAIAGNALLLAVASGELPLGLLHLVPAACAIVTMLAVAGRTSARVAAAPSENVTEP